MADIRNDIERYLKGEMSPAEMHALEKKALHDPFLADALEGGSGFPNEFAADVNDLNDRISSKATRRPRPSRWYYQAAAAVLLMGVSAIMIYYLSGRHQTVTPITMNQQREKSVRENYAPLTDTVTREESPASEADGAEETAADVKITEPSPPRPEVESRVSSGARVADSSADEPGAEVPTEAEATPLPPVSDKLSNPDSVQARSFALRRDAKKVVARDAAGAPAALSEARVAEVHESLTIRGKVTDIDDGLPLPGVNVVAKGTGMGTVTDLNGNFELTVSDSTESLVFSFVGLQSREVSVPPTIAKATDVNVQMEPDVSSLSEVVVVGYGTESTFDFEGTKWEPAEPAGGKRAFRRYLESNLHYPEAALENKVEGKVTVQFTIEPTGSLTDFRVVRGLGYGCDEEVIRLIRNGPQWKPTKRNDEPVRGKGKVKMRFALPAEKK